MPVSATPDDLVGTENQIFLNMGAYQFSDIARYAAHPVFSEKAATSIAQERQAVFGVRCEPTGRGDTGAVATGTTGVIITSGCDGVPGGSGGPTVLSRDGGLTYSIVGVANSYRPNTEYNKHTRIEGAFAAHLARFVDLVELPAATGGPAPSHIAPEEPLGPWEPTQEMEDHE